MKILSISLTHGVVIGNLGHKIKQKVFFQSQKVRITLRNNAMKQIQYDLDHLL